MQFRYTATASADKLMVKSLLLHMYVLFRLIEVYTPADVLKQRLMKNEEELNGTEARITWREKLNEDYKVDCNQNKSFCLVTPQMKSRKYADDQDFDLVVVGSHGTSNNVSRFLGKYKLCGS